MGFMNFENELELEKYLKMKFMNFELGIHMSMI
jgi:hypothetical protein